MGSRGPGRGVRWPRSPRGAEVSAAQATVRGRIRRSGAEPLASLGSTTSKHATTALGSHAGHEAVLALARTLLGLICPLHRCVPGSSFSISRSGPSHTNGWRSASLRARIPVARLAGRDSSRGSQGRSNGPDRSTPARTARFGDQFRSIDADSLLPRKGRCYSGATPGTGPPRSGIVWPVGALIRCRGSPISARRNID